MVDTVKLKRLMSRRRAGGPGGRVEHDSLGNAVWTRSRASDSEELPDISALSILEDMPDASKVIPSVDEKKTDDSTSPRVVKMTGGHR